MPRDGHSSLTVSDEAFEELNRRKPADDTWDEFLTQAAKMNNPYPEGAGEKLHSDEQTRVHLSYIQTRESPGDARGKVEVYWWGHGKKFLMLPNEEIVSRHKDRDAAVNDDLYNFEPEDGE